MWLQPPSCWAGAPSALADMAGQVAVLVLCELTQVSPGEVGKCMVTDTVCP